MEATMPKVRGVKRENRLKSNLLFLGKFLRHGNKIASVWPSSKALSKATCREVDFEQAKVIVELGAGTGPITQAIADRLKPHTRFIAIERDADFARILHQRFAHNPKIEIVHADVRRMDAILKARNIDKVDAIISGLPTPTLPAGIRRRVLAIVRKYLAPGGVYSNITEVPFIYWGYYKSLFRHVDFQFVVANMPPGGVYHCRNPKLRR